MKESIMYCQKYKNTKFTNYPDGYFYTHFINHPETCRLYDESKEVYKVKVRELKEGEKSIYWGWWDNESNRFEHVHPTKGILSIVFPYSMKLYEEKGEGKAYNVIIEEIRIINKKEDDNIE